MANPAWVTVGLGVLVVQVHGSTVEDVVEQTGIPVFTALPQGRAQRERLFEVVIVFDAFGKYRRSRAFVIGQDRSQRPRLVTAGPQKPKGA